MCVTYIHGYLFQIKMVLWFRGAGLGLEKMSIGAKTIKENDTNKYTLELHYTKGCAVVTHTEATKGSLYQKGKHKLCTTPPPPPPPHTHT